MKTVRRLLYSQIGMAVLFTTVAFLALFFFFDTVEELQDVGKNGVTTLDAFTASAFTLPRRLYDVFPITLLIGTIVALSRLAQTSEFTILRTGGLSPARALRLLASLAVICAVLMALVGDMLVPWAEQWAATHKSNVRQGAGLPMQQGGAWLRDKQPTTTELSASEQTPTTVTVNVGGATDERQLRNVRIFMTNDKGQLVRQLSAREATIMNSPTKDETSVWRLRNVTDLQWQQQINNEVGVKVLHVKHVDETTWNSHLPSQVVAAAVLPIDTMSIASLWRYTRHLSANAQASQKYELQFWKKAFAPLACLVMVSLALPFAYLQARQGGITMKVFGGIMLGISFVLVNHITSHLGLLHQWEPWLAASVPSLVYTFMAMAAFTWLVRNR